MSDELVVTRFGVVTYARLVIASPGFTTPENNAGWLANTEYPAFRLSSRRCWDAKSMVTDANDCDVRYRMIAPTLLYR